MRARAVGTAIGLVLCAVGLTVSTANAAGQPTSKLIRVVPGIGIGDVRLNETHGAVDHQLGAGQLIRRGFYADNFAYRSGTIRIYVSYGSGRVDGVDTNSPEARIYGRPLADGLTKLERFLRARGWTVESCRGETFTKLGEGGPGTGIAWRDGKLDYVQVDAGGSIGDWCDPLPGTTSDGGSNSPGVFFFGWFVVVGLSVGLRRLYELAPGSVDPRTGRALPDKAPIPELMRARKERHAASRDAGDTA
jgi:hypothetical protein